MFARFVGTVTFCTALQVAIVAVSAAAADPAPPTDGAAILRWTPEQQAWGYRNMEKLYPMSVIARGDSVHPLPVSPNSIDPKFHDGGKTYDTAAYMSAFRASGVLVIKDGNIILERYGLGRGPEDRWTSFSVAKSVTSTLIGAAIRDGKIKSLDDAVTLYIPELKDSAYEGVTVRQLITMTSGVKWNEDYADPNSDVAKVDLSILEPGVNPVVSYMRKLPREAKREASLSTRPAKPISRESCSPMRSANRWRSTCQKRFGGRTAWNRTESGSRTWQVMNGAAAASA